MRAADGSGVRRLTGHPPTSSHRQVTSEGKKQDTTPSPTRPFAHEGERLRIEARQRLLHHLELCKPILVVGEDWVESTSKCTTEGELDDLVRCAVAEALARPIIQRMHHGRKHFIADGREIGALREVAA